MVVPGLNPYILQFYRVSDVTVLGLNPCIGLTIASVTFYNIVLNVFHAKTRSLSTTWFKSDFCFGLK